MSLQAQNIRNTDIGLIPIQCTAIIILRVFDEDIYAVEMCDISSLYMCR